MARKIITVTIDSSTTATGPYNVYTTSMSDDNLLEANVSLADMKASRIYRVNTDVSQVVIVNKNADCCCSVKTFLINAAPTPAPTTAAPTTAPTTAAPTTAAPTTAAPTTAAPTTSSPTTAAPTTAAPTTAAPTTTTPSPTTAAPTTAAPTTAAPTTASPTTAAPTTASPTTAAPTTAAPTTSAPTTAAPTNVGTFTVRNITGSGQIDDVTTTGGAYFYFFNTGNFPIANGQQADGGGAALTSAPIFVSISNYSSPSNSCLSLYINGVLNEQLTMSLSGTYSFFNKTFTTSDIVLIQYTSGDCPN
jgi:hypothetical protein